MDADAQVPPVASSQLSFVADPLNEDVRVLPEGTAPPPSTDPKGTRLVVVVDISSTHPRANGENMGRQGAGWQTQAR